VRTLSLAALQTAPIPGDPEATLASLGERLRAVRATSPHVQVVILPELHLSAPPLPLSNHSGHPRRVAVEIPGALTERLGAMAREAGLWLVPGSLYERAGERIHNTVVVLSPDGELVATYRKVFPWQPHETCTPGSVSSPSTSPTSAGSASPSATTEASRRRFASSPGWAPRP
jgi:formamidase